MVRAQIELKMLVLQIRKAGTVDKVSKDVFDEVTARNPLLNEIKQGMKDRWLGDAYEAVKLDAERSAVVVKPAGAAAPMGALSKTLDGLRAAG